MYFIRTIYSSICFISKAGLALGGMAIAGYGRRADILSKQNYIDTL